MADAIRVTVWNEYRHEREDAEIAKLYPAGIHGAIAAALGKEPGLRVRTATLDEPEHGLTDEVLANTDVLTWWGHRAHGEVRDEVVAKVHQRVVEGMGLVVLHSAHFSKIFRSLMGTPCDLKWREIGEKTRLWVVCPGHPIVAGVPECIVLPHEEMYGEHFDIPQPDVQVFISWFPGGEVFRSGCCFYRGQGKIFYFQPGHETYPTYYNADVLRVIANAVRWAAPVASATPTRGHIPVPLEPVDIEK
jgi:trehalose utilization protein